MGEGDDQWGTSQSKQFFHPRCRRTQSALDRQRPKPACGGAPANGERHKDEKGRDEAKCGNRQSASGSRPVRRRGRDPPVAGWRLGQGGCWHARYCGARCPRSSPTMTPMIGAMSAATRRANSRVQPQRKLRAIGRCASMRWPSAPLGLLRAAVPAPIRIEQSLRAAPPVMGDKAQLDQVIVNLASDAAHVFGGIGTVRIEVALSDGVAASRTREGNSKGWSVRFSVSNTGSGIPEAVRAHLQALLCHQIPWLRHRFEPVRRPSHHRQSRRPHHGHRFRRARHPIRCLIARARRRRIGRP